MYTKLQRFPDFLLIGAMKAGTTSLCGLLGRHPDIFIPSVKEPHTLMLQEVMTPQGRENYSKLFEQAGSAAFCGEGSTGYSKAPWSNDVPERAKAICGKELKLLYIVRDPVDRAISHHFHLFRAGEASPSFSEAVAKHPVIIRTGLYAMQLKVWLKSFNRENFHIISFENFVKDQCNVLSSVWDFLGCQHKPDLLTEVLHLNSGTEQLAPQGFVASVRRSLARTQYYKHAIAPRIPIKVKNLFQSVFYRTTARRPSRLTTSELAWLIDQFEADLKEFRELVGNDFPMRTPEQLRELHLKD